MFLISCIKAHFSWSSHTNKQQCFVGRFIKHTLLHGLKQVSTGNCDSDLLLSSEEIRERSLRAAYKQSQLKQIASK